MTDHRTNDRRNGDDMAYPCQGPNVPAYGLTKRELFAAMAMQSIIRQHPLLSISTAPNRYAQEAAIQAAYYADALLAALKESQP